ncbi:hypothetical protein SLEP1_g2760 [Rubroshorea leprosula]|uniref:Uncharacterized protein n=1 Tax=Rubroshorea leprosula TaxID=152421 RepID=A0AAV5HI85_9ROSI|nr:hypothetical protein SLEP1_g2760 [Rubroshorea leprosula]
MADEVEVKEEVEAVQAVYGDDCVVIDSFPPHLHLHIKPRTADVSSQQFVEAVVGIQAGPEVVLACKNIVSSINFELLDAWLVDVVSLTKCSAHNGSEDFTVKRQGCD